MVTHSIVLSFYAKFGLLPDQCTGHVKASRCFYLRSFSFLDRGCLIRLEISVLVRVRELLRNKPGGIK